jgi:LuxR family transcriptional regulator, maltose regulon positive regulatory protein
VTSRASLRREPPPSRPRGVRPYAGPQQAAASAVVSRSALVNRLRAARSQPVVAVVAPSGYGKTELLSQWAVRDERRFAAVTIDPGLSASDLVSRVVRALGTCDVGELDLPVPGRPPLHWIWQTAVPRLAAAMRAVPEPIVLAFDNAHRLEGDAVAVVTALVQHVPEGSLVALVGRTPALPSVPRLRAAGDMLELGAEDLAFTRREARTLLEALVGSAVADSQLDDVLERTEGWPAGVVLAALSLPAYGRRRAVRTVDRDLCRYVESECLAALTHEQRSFLRQTSVLGRLSGPLCDAVLERCDSAQVLASLEPTGLVLVALDRDRRWFRCHRVVREQLRRELTEQEPRLVSGLERRAAAWYEAGGDFERALRHRYAAGDLDDMARIIEAAAVQMHNDGLDETLSGWLSLLEENSRFEEQPEAAVLAARLHAQRGEADKARRCLEAATRGVRARAPGRPDPAISARIELVRAAMCRDGVESMLADAEHALDRLEADDCWRPYGLLLQGIAYALLDEAERADLILARAVNASKRLGSTETEALGLTQRALLAMDGGDRVCAAQLLDAAREAIRSSGLESYPTSALALAASARFELRHGHSLQAFAELESARTLVAVLGSSLPWLAVQTRLELVHAHVSLRDAAAARSVLAEADASIAAAADLGALRRRRDLVAAEIEAVPAAGDGRSVGLTAAELRLVPMLGTHLSFREIGARFFLSRNTVKTQAISVYRKLGASSRSEAVVRAISLGLVEEAAEADGLIRKG